MERLAFNKYIQRRLAACYSTAFAKWQHIKLLRLLPTISVSFVFFIYVASIYCVSDKFSGGSGDWSRGVAGIRYTFELELRDRGRLGFLLPANYIEPVGEETWSAVQVLTTQIVSELPDNAAPTAATRPMTDGASGEKRTYKPDLPPSGLLALFSVCAVIALLLSSVIYVLGYRVCPHKVGGALRSTLHYKAEL